MFRMLSVGYEADSYDDPAATLTVFTDGKKEPLRMLNGIFGEEATNIFKRLINDQGEGAL